MPDRDFLKALFTADSILIVERDGTISWCNDEASDLLSAGLALPRGGDFIGTCGLFFPEPGTRLRLDEFPVDRIFAGEAIHGVEVCVRNSHTGETPLWFSVSAEPVYSRDNAAVESVMIVAHDVTGRRGALEAVEASNAALRALVHSSPLPILSFGTDGNVTFWNRAAEDVFGWSEAEVLGRPIPFIPAEKEEEHRQMRRRDLSGQVIVNREIRRLRKDGVPLELSVSTAPIRDKHGVLTGTICVYLDIRERKKLEEQLWQAAKLESLGILAAGVAHDFNNLLTSILGNASLALEEAAPGSGQAQLLGNIIEAVDRAAVLTSHMLAYSGKGRFQMEPIDVSATIAGMAALIESSIGSGVTLRFELPGGLPPVDADRGQLQQIVMNVAINAGEAIVDCGEVLVRTGIVGAAEAGERLDAPGPHVFIEVRDNGRGMDADTMERMYDPFFSTKFTGRGLGLAAVMGIVRGHKGRIRVTSAPDEGTCFVIYLPVAEAYRSRRAGKEDCASAR